MTAVVVVAAALVHDGRVLAARRSTPPRLAGSWEFPGGKVEPGEAEAAALERECREELGVDTAVGAQLDEARAGELVIRLYAVTLLGGRPEPLEDHDQLRWLGAHELDDVAWLPLDEELLPAARRHLLERIHAEG